MRPHFTSPVLLLAAGLFCVLTGLRAAPKDPTMGGQSTAQFSWAEESPGALTLRDKGLPVLTYKFGTVRREGTAEKYWRSGYIHPIWSLDGRSVLTDDFPADHLHHRGLFWAWPRITVGDKVHDLWQFDGAPITHRFLGWTERSANDSYAILELENGWYANERQIMRERVKLLVRQRTTEGRQMILEVRLAPGDQPVTLQGAKDKGYGGVSLRMAVTRQEECRIETQLGARHEDLMETALNWAEISTPIAGQAKRQAITLATAPGHSLPAPGWMTRHYGCLFACWPGQQARTLEPGEASTLRYQIVVRDSD